MEIIPKETPKLPNWINHLFYCFLAFFVLSVIGFFVLNAFLKKAQQELEYLGSALVGEKSFSDPSLEREILAEKKKIDDFSFLIGQRREMPEIFSFLQNISHPKVWFSSFDFNIDKSTINLQGETENFESLGQQLYILDSEESIAGYELGNISVSEGGKIGFNLSISLGVEAKSLPGIEQYEEIFLPI